MTFLLRTHSCGELSQSEVGKSVKLCGWVNTRRDHGGVIFIDLRDRYGMTQVVFDANASESRFDSNLSHRLRNEFVIQVEGVVRDRPEGMENASRSTGKIEVLVQDLVILSESKTPPFMVDDEAVTETLRLKYRYLDLRRPSLQRHLKIRHELMQITRDVLNENQFLEIETPILYKSTPEGARDFIVPSRLNPGEFYALPQSPQTLKQLLMVAGMDRYYQIARCFRDEDLRAERQPEFSQIDIEASFIKEEFIFDLMEKMMARIWKEVHGVEVSTPFPRLSYQEAMERYGSDKPDTRFELEIESFSSIFENSEFQVFKNAVSKTDQGYLGSISGICVRDRASSFSRKDLDQLTQTVTTHGAKGLLWIKVQEGVELQSPAAKFFSDAEKKALLKQFNLKPNDLVLIVADSKSKTVYQSLGALRLEVARKLNLIPKEGEGPLHFLWVCDFPLLEYDDKDGRYYAAHHPFTLAHEDDLELLKAGKDLNQIRAKAYDLVLNGVELGGGSLRIYQEEIQAAMFKALGMSLEQAKEQFGFFLEGLSYGTPPHGGIALGLDRLAALVCGVGPIRDVMAFPKTQKGQCLMSGTPSKVAAEQLAELGLSVSRRKT